MAKRIIISAIYPSLGRYFDNLSDLASSCCMSRATMRKCLDGKKEFSESEKKAIAAGIMARIRLLPDRNYQPKDYTDAQEAWRGKFDEIYRRKAV